MTPLTTQTRVLSIGKQLRGSLPSRCTCTSHIRR